MAPNKVHVQAAQLAGYQLGEKLGEGTFKLCYEAENGSGKVAFKVLKPNGAIARNERELRVMQECSHKNVACCLASGAVDVEGARIEYVVEPFFSNGSLAQRIAAKKLDLAAAMSLGSDMIEAIAHLSEREFVHRDIKPENVMFDENDVPVLTDFGLVRALGESSLTASSFLQGPGTPTFMPPEQLHNQKAMIDWRADQFALGITLSVSTTGVHPFGSSYREIIEAMANHEEPTSDFVGATRTFGLPVIEKMVQPYPVNRYCDISTLIKEWKRQSA